MREKYIYRNPIYQILSYLDLACPHANSQSMTQGTRENNFNKSTTPTINQHINPRNDKRTSMLLNGSSRMLSLEAK